MSQIQSLGVILTKYNSEAYLLTESHHNLDSFEIDLSLDQSHLLFPKDVHCFCIYRIVPMLSEV